jgi:hypothetical protein
MNGRERDDPFCSNPDCILHIRSGDAGVIGSGNWAELADGTIIGRGIYYGLYLCDSCGRAWRAVAPYNIA